MDLHVITNFKYQITFATKLGVRNIAFLGSGILLVNYIVSILAAIYMLRVNINLHDVRITYMKFFIHDRLHTNEGSPSLIGGTLFHYTVYSKSIIVSTEKLWAKGNDDHYHYLAGGVECTVTKGIGGSFDEEENHLQGVEDGWRGLKNLGELASGDYPTVGTLIWCGFGVLEVVQVVAGRPTKLVLVEGTNVGMKVDETKADVEVIAIDQGIPVYLANEEPAGKIGSHVGEFDVEIMHPKGYNPTSCSPKGENNNIMFKVKQRAQSMVQSLLMIDKMELEGDDSDGMYW
ncbi:hypothetical protein JHK85_000627 [Glycine max]|nr:hypothetical protein JHK85_000627 [Glycine max]KAG5087998.1 hypothetical protein JHK86_000610 [Glycine max]